MAQHPYWSGQIRISLVSLGVNIFTATRRASQVPLHEIHRPTGERIHHRNVIEDGHAVPREEIAKGFEIEKGEYVLLEPEEIEQIKLPSSDELELTEFADIGSIPLFHFERPYYVLPDGKKSEEVYAVLSESLRETGKAGIGQIALRGREELCALLPYGHGMILETLRYVTELQEMPEVFTEPAAKPKSEYTSLARELIRKNSHPLHLDKFHDHYHEALMELIEAKKAHRRPHFKGREARPEKVVDFMDALRRSLKEGERKSSHSHAHGHAPRRRKSA